MALMVMTSSKVKVATTSSMAVQLEVVAPKMATTPSKVVMETIKLMVAPTMINSLVTLVMTPSMVAAEMTPSMVDKVPTSSMVAAAMISIN